jgi:glyceraldehyde 3-phosphate dehydrogenase
MINIAINGFGRIGKSFLRTILQDPKAQEKINVSAINIGPADPEHIAYELQYDSIMGTLNKKIEYKNSKIYVDKYEIVIISECDPKKIDWGKLEIDWVVDASGVFRSREKATLHLNSGAKKVLITAPAIDEDITIIPGINDDKYISDKHHLVSLGSCTTNCFAPMIKVLMENFTLKNGLMTTIHAYTNDQVLLDVDHKDIRRGRAAALNMIPTKTGADKVIIKLYPQLEGKLQAISIRVPTPKVSLVDFTFECEEKLTSEAINSTFKKASETNLKNILQFCEKPLVSTDFSANPHSCIIDSLITKAAGNLGKVFGWYDNEWGYAVRLKDFLLHN